MKPSRDWEFNVLGIYNYRKPGKLYHFLQFIKENHNRLEGDIAEAGTFNGKSLLAIALLLNELGSDKTVYGYDTFSGFPPVYHKYDEYSLFETLHAEERISSEHLDDVRKLREMKSLLHGNKSISIENISTSGDFSICSLNLLQQKIDYLGLENIKIVKGPFDDTMLPETAEPANLMACLVDCDLYSSYKTCLPFFWSRLVHGGYLYLDEYYSLKFPGARLASDEFFADKDDKPFRHDMTPGDFERWGVLKIH